jgi:hypothetical protein
LAIVGNLRLDLLGFTTVLLFGLLPEHISLLLLNKPGLGLLQVCEPVEESLVIIALEKAHGYLVGIAGPDEVELAHLAEVRHEPVTELLACHFECLLLCISRVFLHFS